MLMIKEKTMNNDNLKNMQKRKNHLKKSSEKKDNCEDENWANVNLYIINNSYNEFTW